MLLFSGLLFQINNVLGMELHLESYSGLGYSKMDFRQNETPVTAFSHSGQGLGVLTGIWAGVCLQKILIGGNLEFSWQSYNLKRKNLQSEQSESVYSFNAQRWIMGGLIGVQFSKDFALYVDYLFSVKNKIGYSNRVGGNPLFEKDSLSGDGFGVVFGYTAQELFKLNFETRFYQYKRWNRQGINTTLPSNQFSPISSTELIATVSIPLRFK